MEDRTAAMRERVGALVLVCTNDREEHACCGDAGGRTVADRVRAWLRERGLYWSPVAVSTTGCLGMCSEAGTGIVVQPHDEWFAEVQPEEVPALMERVFGADSSVGGGVPVEGE